jgi:Fe-S-cluster containining protein
MIQGAGRVRFGEDTVEVKFTVPEGLCTPVALLPDAQALANQIAVLGAARAKRVGGNISCQAGCGACCRQLVPVSPTEALHLSSLVDAMPVDRANEIRKRFDEARARIESANLPPRADPDADKAAFRAFGLAYFHLGVACPFLENESCSIHPQRPLVCREYQVTSPPEACAEPGAGRVRQAPVPVSVWSVFSRSVSKDGSLEWMPLVEALRYAGKRPDPEQVLTGPRRVESFLGQLQRDREPENKTSGPP